MRTLNPASGRSPPGTHQPTRRQRPGRRQSSANPLLTAGTTRILRATIKALLDGDRSMVLPPPEPSHPTHGSSSSAAFDRQLATFAPLRKPRSSRSGQSLNGSSRSTTRSRPWTASSSTSSRPPPRARSSCSASQPATPDSCSSPPERTSSASTARAHSRCCAAPARSPPPQAKRLATASTTAATAKPTALCT